MSEDLNDLPLEWEWVNLGDICDITGGGTPRRDEASYYSGGNIPWATPTDIDSAQIRLIASTATVITELGLAKSSARLLQPGAVLFSSRASIGKIAIASVPLCTNQGFANLTPLDGIDSWYIAYGLKHFTEQIKELGSGTTYLEVAKSALREFTFPLAPTSEQRRIVEKIEALFEQSRTARTALDRIPPQIRQFRQSVLAAAFRGDLTERDPNDEPAWALLERIGAQPLGDPSLPELPEGWCWVKYGQLVSFVTSGSRGWARYYSDSGPLFLRVGDLHYDSISIDFSEVVSVEPPEGAEKERTRVKPRDLLIAITGNTIGMVAVVPDDIGEAYINQHIALTRPIEGYDVTYVAHYLASREGGQSQIASYYYGMTKPGMNLTSVRDLHIPLAPLREQIRVVRKIEGLVETTNTLESSLVAARHHAEALDQAILARAFRGGLVPQDPADEPASALLERVKKETN